MTDPETEIGAPDLAGIDLAIAIGEILAWWKKAKVRHRVSDKTRRKLSAAARGNKHSLGRVWSPESRAKLSAAMKGNKNCKGHSPSPEHRQKIAAALKGRQIRPPGWKHADETKAQISATLKGHYTNPKTRLALRIAQRVIKLFRPEVHAKKAALSAERMRAQMQDPVFRAKAAAAAAAYRERRRSDGAGMTA